MKRRRSDVHFIQSAQGVFERWGYLPMHIPHIPALPAFHAYHDRPKGPRVDYRRLTHFFDIHHTTSVFSKIRQKLAVRGFVNKRGGNITVNEDY
jgi:hypothetical protein